MKILVSLTIVVVFLNALMVNYSSATSFVGNSDAFQIKQLHEDPDIYLIEHFITDEEGQRIMELARPHFKRSLVKGAEVSNGRTSSTAFLDSTDKTVRAISQRAADMLGAPVEHVEFQVVRYTHGQKYDPHHDYFSQDLMQKRTSQRLMTFFVYLNDLEPDAGGKTVFPRLNLAITPQKNAAVFWRNLDEDGRKDERTFHGGRPVKHGEKWAINIWIHDKKPG